MRTPIPRPNPAIQQPKWEPVTLPPPTAKVGRPSGLTSLVANKILMALRSGSYRVVAAMWAGVPEDTMSRWMTMTGEPYETFQRLVVEAEAHAELRMVTEVVSQASQDAKYAVTFLERKFPERWGRVVVQPANQTNVTLDLGAMLEKIHARMLQYKDPREARAALSNNGDVRVVDVQGQRVLPRDPRPARSPDDRIIPVDGTDDEGESDDAEP